MDPFFKLRDVFVSPIAERAFLEVIEEPLFFFFSPPGALIQTRHGLLRTSTKVPSKLLLSFPFYIFLPSFFFFVER